MPQPSPIDILLVEDNPGDVYLIREALALGRIPKRLHVVNDGEDALRYLYRDGKYRDANLPDLILLDLNLPKVDGREVLDMVKEHKALRHIPIVVLSTSTSERDIVSAYEHHANCYLSKPANLEEFIDLIQQVEDYWLQLVALPAS